MCDLCARQQFYANNKAVTTSILYNEYSDFAASAFRAGYNYDIRHAYSNEGMKMQEITKDSYVIYANGDFAVVDGLEATKQKAREFANQTKSKIYYFKAVGSIAPKFDVEEVTFK